MYQIDAFARDVFRGNPAAVVPLEQWPEDAFMQKIAMENNLSETAFFVPEKQGYAIRWMTPTKEVDMCGHATLASAYVLFETLGYEKEEIIFYSKSGELRVKREGELLSMDFPAQRITEVARPEQFADIFGKAPLRVYKSMDYIAVFENETFIREFTPDLERFKTLDGRGVVITAQAKDYDFVCRMFAPNYGIDEDPVTGSAFTQLVPYWAEALQKRQFRAKQVSRRGGEVLCALEGARCVIKGRAVTYFEGEIFI